MTEAQELIQRAYDIRLRLMRPPNAVQDEGIDLRRHRKLPEMPPKPLRARVTVIPLEAGEKKIKIDMILRATCSHFHIGIADIKGKSRHLSVVYPRHIAVHLSHKHTKLSGMSISRQFQRDHTTILYARDKMKNLVDNSPSDSKLLADIASIEEVMFTELYDK